MDGVKGLRDECVKFAKGDSKRIDALDKHYSAFMDEIKDSIKRKAWFIVHYLQNIKYLWSKYNASDQKECGIGLK